MPVFVYVGKSREGKTHQGELIASDSKEAVRVLRQQEVAVTRLREKPHTPEVQKDRPFHSLFARVKERDLITFTHQCAAMLKAGIPLFQCLDVLSTHSDSPLLRQTLVEVRHDVESGLMFGAALRRHPKVFNEFYVNMVEVGETTGMLDSILGRLATHVEKLGVVKGQILSALAYPLMLLGVAFGVLAFLLVWVIPLFGNMFAEFGSSLPWLTRVVIEFSASLKSNFLPAVLLLIALAFGIRYIYRTPKGHMFLDRWFLGLPLVGDLLRKSAVVHFTRTLSSLVSSGVPILEALRIAGSTTGNVVVKKAVDDACIHISEGKTIAEPLASSRVFPRMVTHMISIGESAGSLDSMLEKIADLYEQEVNRTVTTLTAMFEPLVILLVGLGIGILVVAMYLPIFTMGSLIG